MPLCCMRLTTNINRKKKKNQEFHTRYRIIRLCIYWSDILFFFLSMNTDSTYWKVWVINKLFSIISIKPLVNSNCWIHSAEKSYIYSAKSSRTIRLIDLVEWFKSIINWYLIFHDYYNKYLQSASMLFLRKNNGSWKFFLYNRFGFRYHQIASRIRDNTVFFLGLNIDTNDTKIVV